MIQNVNMKGSNIRKYFLPTKFSNDSALDKKLDSKTGYIELSGLVNKEDRNYHYIEISKSSKDITIKYEIQNWNRKPFYKDIPFTDTFAKKSTTTRELTISDIESIVETLRMRYYNQEFIDMVIDELHEFERIIKESNGTIEKDSKLTDPSTYINFPLWKTVNILRTYKDQIFSEILKENKDIEAKSYQKTIK